MIRFIQSEGQSVQSVKQYAQRKIKELQERLLNTPSNLKEQCLGETDNISLEDLDYDKDFANIIKLPSGVHKKYHCFSDLSIKTLFMSHTDGTQRPRNPLTRTQIPLYLMHEIEEQLVKRYPDYRTFRQRGLNLPT